MFQYVKGPSTVGVRSLWRASYPSCHYQVHRVREYSTDLCLCTGVFYRLMFVVFSSMPRTYKRKTERACYSQDDLQRALEAVRNRMLVRHASLQHGVSEKTYSEA